jgi:hypothetical protein
MRQGCNLQIVGPPAALGGIGHISTSVFPDRDNHGNSPHLRLSFPLHYSPAFHGLTSYPFVLPRIYAPAFWEPKMFETSPAHHGRLHTFNNVPAIPSVTLLGTFRRLSYYAYMIMTILPTGRR